MQPARSGITGMRDGVVLIFERKGIGRTDCISSSSKRRDREPKGEADWFQGHYCNSLAHSEQAKQLFLSENWNTRRKEDSSSPSLISSSILGLGSWSPGPVPGPFTNLFSFIYQSYPKRREARNTKTRERERAWHLLRLQFQCNLFKPKGTILLLQLVISRWNPKPSLVVGGCSPPVHYANSNADLAMHRLLWSLKQWCASTLLQMWVLDELILD